MTNAATFELFCITVTNFWDSRRRRARSVALKLTNVSLEPCITKAFHAFFQRGYFKTGTPRFETKRRMNSNNFSRCNSHRCVISRTLIRIRQRVERVAVRCSCALQWTESFLFFESWEFRELRIYVYDCWLPGGPWNDAWVLHSKDPVGQALPRLGLPPVHPECWLLRGVRSKNVEL